jgi:hypothetical protein
MMFPACKGSIDLGPIAEARPDLIQGVRGNPTLISTLSDYPVHSAYRGSDAHRI